MEDPNKQKIAVDISVCVYVNDMTIKYSAVKEGKKYIMPILDISDIENEKSLNYADNDLFILKLYRQLNENNLQGNFKKFVKKCKKYGLRKEHLKKVLQEADNLGCLNLDTTFGRN